MKFLPGDLRFRYPEYSFSEYRKLMDAVGSFFTENGIKSVFLGHDARLSSPLLFDALTTSMREHGIDVYTAGTMTSSCFFYWNCMKLGVPGVMITASHNPSVYNGLKIVDSSLRPMTYGTGYGRIEELMEAPPEKAAVPGRMTICDRLPEYISWCIDMSGLSENTGISILIDFLHGVNARETGTALARYQNIRADYMHAVPDGSFPAGDPNPINESSITEFKKKLSEGSYDLGIVFDGDGDRTAVYDGSGVKIESSFLLPVIAGFLSEDAMYLSDAKTPVPLLKAGTGLCRTGHVHIKRMMAEHPEYTAAAEGSGHFFYRIMTDDGGFVLESSLLTLLLAIRAKQEREEDFRRMTERCSAYVTLPEISKEFDDPEETLDAVRKHFEKYGAGFIEKDCLGSPLHSLIITADDYQIYQHASETEAGTVRWQITEYVKDAASAALKYLNSLS